MKILNFFVVLIGFGAAFSSCQQSSDHPPQPPTPDSQPAPSLDGLAPRDLIRAKYDKAQLECQVKFPTTIAERTNNGITQNIQNGSDSYTWDLLDDYSDTRTIQLQARSGEVSLIATIEVDQIQIEDNTVKSSDGTNTYELKDSPVLTGKYSFNVDKAIYEPVTGSALAPQGSGPFTIYEGMNNDFATSSGSVQVDGSPLNVYQVQIGCVLDTHLNQEYQNQFLHLDPLHPVFW
jgi:hypothetical protein